MAELHENAIEWFDGDKIISATLHQKKFVNKILRLADNPENNIEILAQNSDGSIFVHLPVSMLKLSLKRKDNLNAEQKSALRKNIKKAQAAKLAKKELK